jgi:sarcosine oxidase subunit delta
VSFFVPCPACGPRPAEEFACRGEVTVRPAGGATLRELTDYLYLRANAAAPQREWWHHRLGCGSWFVAERDTRTNEILGVER